MHTQEIMNWLDRAMARGYEGIMFKSLSSVYSPGARDNEWVKLKPDYVHVRVHTPMHGYKCASSHAYGMWSSSPTMCATSERASPHAKGMCTACMPVRVGSVAEESVSACFAA